MWCGIKERLKYKSLIFHASFIIKYRIKFFQIMNLLDQDRSIKGVYFSFEEIYIEEYFRIFFKKLSQIVVNASSFLSHVPQVGHNRGSGHCT